MVEAECLVTEELPSGRHSPRNGLTYNSLTSVSRYVTNSFSPEARFWLSVSVTRGGNQSK